ncbi:MAG TPA: sensor histidine kinase [Atopostipes sp.]|nr:sensor histidine kinase [Atopostipes sp.]
MTLSKRKRVSVMQSVNKKEREWIPSFLRTLRTQCFLFISMLLIFGLLWLFTRMPFSIYWYGVLLSLVIWMVSIGVQALQYRRALQRAENLSATNELPFADVDGLESIYLKKYQELTEEYHDFKQQQNEKSQEQMDYFTLWLHQIKTPIAAISLIFQRQKEELPERKQLEQEMIRLNDYTHMALNYLKLENPGKEMDLEEVDLDEVIKETVKKYAVVFIYNNIRLNYEALNAAILTDRKWLQVLLEQLLSNSLKYTKTGEISIYMETNQVLVIEDNGSGIRKEDLPKIFEKGYTGLNGRLHEKSTGLGLFLSRKICQRLGHRLTIESEPGEGTIARIHFEREEVKIFD